MDSNAALAQLQQTQSSAQDPNAILAGQQQQLGVNAAKDTVTGLRGAINNTTKLLTKVAPGVMGRTQNSLVTDAQANRVIQNEQAPISATLEKQGTQYNQANQDYEDLSGKASQAAQLQYQGQQDKLSYLQNLYNTLYGREQDSAKAAAEERDRQEDIRRYNTSLSASSAKSSGGSQSATQSNAATKASVIQHVTDNLAKNSGKDGFVSRATFGGALSDWQAIGGTTRDFWKQYGRYVNPATKSQYPGYAQR